MTGLLVFNDVASQLAEACIAGYRTGLAAMVKWNKKKILRLMESGAMKSMAGEMFADTPLFNISYTGSDKELLRNFEVEAFTVAGVLQYEVEEKLKAIAKSILDGSHPYLQAHPESDIKALWRDEAYNILADYIEIDELPPPSYLQTNLRTATTSAYHAAEWQRLRDLKDIYTAYRYMTRDDDRVRDEHRELHGKVFSADDPIWDVIWPPNGWNCRCYVEPLSENEQADIDPVDRIQITNKEQRETLIGSVKVQKDFRRNSGQSGSIWGKWLQTKFKDADYYTKFKEVFDYSRSVGRYQEKGLLDSVLDGNKAEFVQRALTRESWEKEFPNNEAETPIGTAKLTGGKQWKSQFEKMLKKDDERYTFWGLIKPTLNDPAIVIRDRDGKLRFVRKFVGKTENIFLSVGYRDGDLLYIISHTKQSLLDTIKKLEKGEAFYLNSLGRARGAFAEDSRANSFSIGGNLLKFTSKLADKDEIVNERWGEFRKPGGCLVREIRYRIEGFEWRENDGEWKGASYAEIDDVRKGVLLNADA